MKKKLPKFIKHIEPEWVCDGEFIDFAITFDLKLFDELKIKPIEENEEELRNEFGFFYKLPDNVSWFWGIARKRIGPNSYNRKKVGSYFLTDCESGGHIPNNKFFRELKKELEPFLNEALEDFLKKELKDK